MWLTYARTHIPPAYPGMEEIIRRQKAEGGLVCVVSHSGRENITRDYQELFGMQPDAIYSWELPETQRKPSPYPLLDIMDRFGLAPREMLVVDDLRPGYEMAHSAGVPIAFAGWSRLDFPDIAGEMQRLCDFSFDSPEKLAQFLFD